MHSTLTTRSVMLVTGTALAALVVAGCGSSAHTTGDHSSGSHAGTAMPVPSASYGPAASGPHNDADITFVTDMLPHHAQAVEMADMALHRDTNARVKALAAQIKGAQAPEISSMTGWLVGWGAPLPSAEHSMGGMAAHAGGDGMMSASEMTALDGASGSGFAREWLTDMVTHHKGAVAMARTELADGQSADAKALASRIIASQSLEIDQMTTLLPTIS
jgi:uncharacterized protein (DUF305 family)